jgi:hypothetical protein
MADRLPETYEEIFLRALQYKPRHKRRRDWRDALPDNDRNTP